MPVPREPINKIYFIVIKISTAPGDDIDHAGREADLECEAGEVERGEGSLLGRLRDGDTG